MNALIIFARYPEKGKVKTRLAKVIGDEKALLFYMSCLKDLVKEHKNRVYNTNFCITPDRIEDFKNFLKFDNVKSQKGNNLGERMYNSFSHFLKNYDKVVLIGSDIPNLSHDSILRAFALLDNNDIVLGPAFDGGYYLIGMSKIHDIFSEIPWSTNLVLEKTIEIIKKKKLSYFLLEEKRDIDTADDLNNPVK